ncbi:hypothetical protein SD70_03215 [Gordoniibacillus kamchatkensis]|uniref:Gfo/Idh/MocA family oxidoreductase n=1 Tax=Gordoniibacillus kamchatkensis TaxID=1590651 RepID=A0ABR5AMA8_9BACL|nr:Gfo/Idh/MocA family oxidoreductase [Paenibacillus sp. VKM B-2647]KIL42179.1 hypothetical protein SD70_03215 [Paenibacillus sp. VKM B-2647]
MRLYLIGAGVIARTHAEAAAKLPEEAELRAADPNPAALESFRSSFPQSVTFADAAQMLASEPPRDDDIVIVATPPFAHLEGTRLGLLSGRHTLCEKPLAMNGEEAEAMLSLANAKGKLLGCCSVRYKGMLHNEAVKRVIRSGALGDIYHVSFINKWSRSRAGIEYQPASRWFLDKSKSGGGILMDWGPYDFATLIDVLDPSEIEIGAAWMAKPQTAADPADAVYDVEHHIGAYMTLHAAGRPIAVHYERGTCTHGSEQFIGEIEGTLGALRWTPFDSRQPVYLRYDREGSVVEEIVDPGKRGPFTVMDHPLLHFYNQVKGLPSHANVGRRAIDHFLCLGAVYACAESGGKQRVTIAPAAAARGAEQ